MHGQQNIKEKIWTRSSLCVI